MNDSRFYKIIFGVSACVIVLIAAIWYGVSSYQANNPTLNTAVQQKPLSPAVVSKPAEENPTQPKQKAETANKSYFTELDKLNARVWGAMTRVKDATVQLSGLNIGLEAYKEVISSATAVFDGTLTDLDNLKPPSKYAEQQEKYRKGVEIAGQAMAEANRFFDDKNINHLFAAKNLGENAKNLISNAYSWIKNN